MGGVGQVVGFWEPLTPCFTLRPSGVAMVSPKSCRSMMICSSFSRIGLPVKVYFKGQVWKIRKQLTVRIKCSHLCLSHDALRHLEPHTHFWTLPSQGELPAVHKLIQRPALCTSCPSSLELPFFLSPLGLKTQLQRHLWSLPDPPKLSLMSLLGLPQHVLLFVGWLVGNFFLLTMPYCIVKVCFALTLSRTARVGKVPPVDQPPVFSEWPNMR